MIQRNMCKFKNSARPNVFSSSAQENAVLVFSSSAINSARPNVFSSSAQENAVFVFSSSAQGNGMHTSRAANVVDVVAADTIFVLRLSRLDELYWLHNVCPLVTTSARIWRLIASLPKHKTLAKNERELVAEFVQWLIHAWGELVTDLGC